MATLHIPDHDALIIPPDAIHHDAAAPEPGQQIIFKLIEKQGKKLFFKSDLLKIKLKIDQPVKGLKKGQDYKIVF